MSTQVGADERDPSTRGGRARTCVGCGERVGVGDAGAAPLVRLILGPGGVVAVDAGDGAFGRGAHVHPRPGCLAGAVPRGLARSSKGQAQAVLVSSAEASDEALEPLTAVSLARAIREAMDRRIQGLVRSAIRARAASVGADATTGACARGEAELVLVASDAAAAAELPAVRRAVAEGGAVAWGKKQALGAMAPRRQAGGHEDCGVGVMAITSKTIAKAIAEAVRIADACASVERGESVAAPGRKARPRQAPPRNQDGGAPSAGHDGRNANSGGSGRLLAAAPGTGDDSAAGGRAAAPGGPGQPPTRDRAARDSHPRGWVRRNG